MGPLISKSKDLVENCRLDYRKQKPSHKWVEEPSQVDWQINIHTCLSLKPVCQCSCWVCTEGERKTAQTGSCTDTTRIMTLKGNDVQKSSLNGYSLNTKGCPSQSEDTLLLFTNWLAKMQVLQWQRTVVLPSFLLMRSNFQLQFSFIETCWSVHVSGWREIRVFKCAWGLIACHSVLHCTCLQT